MNHDWNADRERILGLPRKLWADLREANRTMPDAVGFVFSWAAVFIGIPLVLLVKSCATN